MFIFLGHYGFGEEPEIILCQNGADEETPLCFCEPAFCWGHSAGAFPVLFFLSCQPKKGKRTLQSYVKVTPMESVC